jgi:S-formylglutathione hydrolase FrmB
VSTPEAGRITSLQIDSAALGCTKTVNIYLPPGYDRASDRYPVVYLLRGHEREWINPTEDDSRQGRTAATVADELIAAGVIPPLLLVMPGLTSDDNQVPCLGINMRAPELAASHPGVGTGRFEDFFVHEVIPAVDQAFRTRADRDHRAVDGFSLGGFSAFALALRHPDRFCSVGAFDATFFFAGFRRPDGSPDTLAEHDLLAPALGRPLDPAALAAVNPADLIDALPAQVLQSLAFHIQTGPAAAEPRVNHARGQHVLERLAARGSANSFATLELPGSSHNWFWADEHLKQTLPRHVAAFGR